MTASDAYLEASLTNRDQIVGRAVFDVFPDNPEDPAADGTTNLRASLERVLQFGVPDAMAVQKYDIRREGQTTYEVRYWSPLNSPVFGDDGSVSYIIHRVEDVTEFVRLTNHEIEQEQATQELRVRTSQMEAEILRRSQQLHEANQRLRTADEAKNEFLSRISHELRTPLTGVLGFGELLQLSPLTADQRDWVRTILKSGHHLLGLLNDVLDIARIEGRELAMSLEPVPLAALLADALEIVRPLADGRGIQLRVDSDGSGSARVHADRQRLRQVILNLLSNAIKYNRPQGEVIVTVKVSERRTQICVTDTGPGLTSDQQSRLFVPFERLDAAGSGIEGTGLGLVLSRQLVETMGGRLTLSSTPGTGSTFSVELSSSEPQAAVAESSADDRVTEPRSYDGARSVLYLDDMAANIELVEHILRRRPDVTIVPAMLGGIALELARERRFDLALLDLHLPDMDGAEVLRQLRLHPATRDLPVVVLSADATSPQLNRLLGAGADAYLTKPIVVRDFLDVVDRFLTRLPS